MRKIFAVAALAALALSAKANDFSYKGVKLGATMDQFQAGLPLYECREDACTYTRSSCAPVHMKGSTEDFERRMAECKDGTSFGGGMVIYGRAQFIEGKLSSLYLVLPTSHARLAGDALEENYGKPTSVDAKPVKNRAGVEFDNWVKIWTEGDTDLIVRRRASQIDEGSVSIRGAAAKAEEQARKNRQTKSGAKDF